MIHFLHKPASKKQIDEMLQILETYIKLAVDIEKKVAAGGGALHADCEAVLLEKGSVQENIWGADWIPASQEVTFEALINIMPKQNNMSMVIQDEDIRISVREVVKSLFKHD